MTNKKLFNGKLQVHQKRLNKIMDDINAFGLVSTDVMNLHVDIQQKLDGFQLALNSSLYLQKLLEQDDKKIAELISQLEQMLNVARAANAKTQCVQK